MSRLVASPWVFAVMTPTRAVRLALLRGLSHSRGAGGQRW